MHKTHVSICISTDPIGISVKFVKKLPATKTRMMGLSRGKRIWCFKQIWHITGSWQTYSWAQHPATAEMWCAEQCVVKVTALRYSMWLWWTASKVKPLTRCFVVVPFWTDMHSHSNLSESFAAVRLPAKYTTLTHNRMSHTERHLILHFWQICLIVFTCCMFHSEYSITSMWQCAAVSTVLQLAVGLCALLMPPTWLWLVYVNNSVW